MPKSFHEVVHARSGARHVQAVARDIGIADARQVRRDDLEAIGEVWNERPPHQRRLGVAVQQHDRGTGAGGEVLESDAVDGCRADVDRVVV